MMKKTGKFKVPIYGFDVEVVIVPDVFKTTEFYSSLVKKFKIPSEGDDPCEGFVLIHKFKAFIVIAENKLSYQTLSHECFHLTIKILNQNNIFEGKDNENAALLNGYINGETYKIINKLGCRII